MTPAGRPGGDDAQRGLEILTRVLEDIEGDGLAREQQHSVQSATTRSRRFIVGSFSRWSVRWVIQAGKPRIRSPYTSGTPRYRPRLATDPAEACR